MRFILYSPVCFEKWNWENSVTKGIGGSETSHVEMAWRLARRGHEVITYAPLPAGSPSEWRGTKWYPIEKADFSLEGIWVLYRCPEVVDKFPQGQIGQTLWLMMQDWDYPQWTDERIQRLDRVITLCQSHGRDVVRAHPSIGPKLWLTSNGVKVDLAEEIEAAGPVERNPYKVVYASSPDRGLRHAIEIFQKAREYVPELEFHAYYGFNNFDKLAKRNPAFARQADSIKKMLKADGVTWHGRVSQKRLYREWMTAGVWLYPTNFNETSCITSMEAQALGAIPLINPIYALRENVLYGVTVEGEPYGDPLTKARFAAELVRLVSQPGLQDKIRGPMMEAARKRFDWERFVDQWEIAASGLPWPADRFPFQLKEDEVHAVRA